MIDYIKYTVDNQTYSLIHNSDGTWSKQADAPLVSGNYSMLFEIKDNGMVTFLDSSDSRYQVYLQVIEEVEKLVDLYDYVPNKVAELYEIKCILNTENNLLDEFYSNMNSVRNDMWIRTASNSKIVELESFLQIKGVGTLSQRKDYLLSLFRKGKKLSGNSIKEMINTIVGADSIIKFYDADDINNPSKGYGLLYVQVLSPDGSKDYRYEDILRALAPLVPEHIKLLVVKYFALWSDIGDNFLTWDSIKSLQDWETIKNYIPPTA